MSSKVCAVCKTQQIQGSTKCDCKRPLSNAIDIAKAYTSTFAYLWVVKFIDVYMHVYVEKHICISTTLCTCVNIIYSIYTHHVDVDVDLVIRVIRREGRKRRRTRS